MKVEASLGDVVDRVTILLLKEERILDEAKVRNVRNELSVLRAAWDDEGLAAMETLGAWTELAVVNGQLWDVEDALREHERRGDFGAAFVELARTVYRLNDRRAELKRAINHQLGSALIEEKSYNSYPADPR